MKRLALVLALLAAAGTALAQTVPELFQKAKEQVKSGSWKDALATLSTVEAEAARPGNENFRKPLEGPLAFYRGVCQANLGQADAARSSFEAFLAVQPNASIDPSMYSKKAVAAFEEARKASAPAAAPGGSPSLFNAYQEFKPPGNASDPPDENWANGPVQWVMTSEEKKAWAQLQSGAERAEFVENFWEARNPNPGSADNTYRTGFERRAAFADAHFARDEKKRGSLTDRGMVFVLLGPPTWGGRKPIRTGEDTSDPAGMSSVPTGAAAAAQAGAAAGSASGRITSGQAAAIADRYSGPETLAPESNMNYQEVWHYRRELLPKNVSYLQVDIVFITRKGYGKDVLQRDSTTLTTLDAAKKKPS